MQQMLRAYKSNEFDEDKKAELSLLLLPHILIPPQQRGLKAPRVGRDVVSNQMFVDMNEEQMSVPEAVASLQKNVWAGIDNFPPLLFRLNKIYYIKLDDRAIELRDAACFCGAMEFLFKCFYVFNLSYPHEIKPVYGLLEHLMQINISIGKSAALSDFLEAMT
ncbi:uncharacterized protein LOC124807164 [Hydra vulgaris]|uniref:uncharacterized protein LOC124807164 n=1 Tax=Hydra vulgaris TaxID=6087 RepID=UPI0032EA5CA8